MKKNKYILLLCCALLSCTKNINHLEKQDIPFRELPLEVQDTLNILVGQHKGGDLDFIFLDKEKMYRTQRKEIGPYLDCYVFTDLTKKRKFKINQGKPFPYIVSNECLYHPRNFNLFVIHGNNIENEIFVKYKLK